MIKKCMRAELCSSFKAHELKLQLSTYLSTFMHSLICYWLGKLLAKDNGSNEGTPIAVEMMDVQIVHITLFKLVTDRVHTCL